jgi:hypothetical protein
MLIIEKSIHPLTEFTPTWYLPFWSTVYPDQVGIDTMRQWILDNEHRLIDQYADQSKDDGGTGLGKQSLTAQYNSFNLFAETNDIPEFQKYFLFLREEYNKFMDSMQTIRRQCIIYAWANVLKPGQSIKKHNHGAHHYAYLSGNMHFDNYQTKTRYFNPVNEMYYEFINVKGGITFFPSYLNHSATEHTEDNPRVSMAFDLFDAYHIESAYESNGIEF